ncbi:MAG: OmpA family protein [Brevinematales bacterium]
MKRIGGILFLLVGLMYGDHQILGVGKVKIGLYDDTSFGFSFSLDGVGVFLKPNRPPTSLLMMSIDGKVISVGSAVGFFHQRPVLTNGGIFASWEARGLKWDIFLSPLKKEDFGEGVLVILSITNVEKRTTSFGVQLLFDVVVPFASPLVMGNGSIKVTQETIFQGKTLITQWGVYSEETNLPGITVIAQDAVWQRVAFAQWKQFYDYPGETPVRKVSLFGVLPATGVTMFYPAQKLEAGASRVISYWMGGSIPPKGVVKKREMQSPSLSEEKAALSNVVVQAPLTNVDATNVAAVRETSSVVTESLQKVIQEAHKEEITEWLVVIDEFGFASATLTDAHQKKLEEWFASLRDSSTLVFEVIGHADEIGSLQVNQKMGKKRAEVVAGWLKTHGISGRNIVIISRGETEPISEDMAKKSTGGDYS